MAALEVNVTESFWQKVVAPLAVIVGVGKALTVMLVDTDVAEQPFTLVTVTE